MTLSTTDILVVGSGPAGSTLARTLAAGGREVTVIDRVDHPRRKPCGGGLPARTCVHLPFPPEEVGGCFVREVALDGGMTGRHLFDASGTWVVERSRFDAALMRVACEAGARFLPHTGYLHAIRTEGGFEVTTTRGRFRAEVLCGCDGVFSRVARDFGVTRPGYGFCLEGVVPYAPGTGEAARHRAVFRLTAVARGYAWAFPRGEGYAVGVGGDFARKPDLRRWLEAFCRKTPELGCGVEDVHGGMLPAYGGALGWYAGAGVYLCGDAAQLVDRLTGEGLYYAVRSGMLAGEALLGRLPSQRPGSAQHAPRDTLLSSADGAGDQGIGDMPSAQATSAAGSARADATGECEHHDLPLVSTHDAAQHDPFVTPSHPQTTGSASQCDDSDASSIQIDGAGGYPCNVNPSAQIDGVADHERRSIASFHVGGVAGYGCNAIPSMRPEPTDGAAQCELCDGFSIDTHGAGQGGHRSTPLPSVDSAGGQGIGDTPSAQATSAAEDGRGGTPSALIDGAADQERGSIGSAHIDGVADHERRSIASFHVGGVAGYGTDAEGAAREYDAAVRGELVVELEYARRCAARVHARHPWTMSMLMGLPRFRRYAGRFVELLSGTTTYAALFASLRRPR